jgi:predicted component of type VI protein secretion system
MPFLILYHGGKEFDRRPLADTPAVVGRGTDCDLSVHDIVLSRRHFRLTPTTDGWLMIDLRSRNGTLVNDKIVEQQILKDRDVIRAGKTIFRFHTGSMTDPVARPAAPPAPAGPSESTAFGLVVPPPAPPPPRKPVNPVFRMASPKPRPRDPDSFADTGVYALLDQIVSSSWDSTYALNARPLPRKLPRPGMTKLDCGDEPATEAERLAFDLHPQAAVPLPAAFLIRTQVPRPHPRLSRIRKWARRLRTVRLF